MKKNPVVLRNYGEMREVFLKGNLLKDQMSGATEKKPIL